MKESTTSAVAAAGLVGVGLWWVLRQRAAPAAVPPPPVPPKCAGLSATSIEAGLTCAGLMAAQKYLDPMWNAVKGLLGGARPGLIDGVRDAIRSTCEKSRPADLATRVYTNNGLNGACLYASKDLGLWCAESRMLDARAAGTYAARIRDGKSGLSYVAPGSAAAAGAVCVVYKSGCVPLPGLPIGWARCKRGTMALRGADAGQPISPVSYGGKSYFEAWAGPFASIYFGSPDGSGPSRAIVDKRTK